MTPDSSSTAFTRDETIVTDRSCHTCGYNLKGLASGGNCPECGAVIKVATQRYNDELGDAPKGYLAITQIGYLVLGLGALGALFGVLTLVLDLFTQQSQDVTLGGNGTFGSLMRTVVLPLASVGWVAGVLLVTIPRPGPDGAPRQERGRPEWATLRMYIRAGAIALGAGLTVWILSDLVGLDILRWVAILLVAGGTAGIVPLCIYLSNIAHWASDSHISAHLMYAGLGFSVSAPLAALLFSPLRLAVGVFLPIVLMVMIGSIFWLCINILKMSSMVSWAIKNGQQRAERDERIAERARREAQDRAARSGPQPETPDGADPHLLANIERQNAAMEHHEGSDDDEELRKDQPVRGHNVDSTGADPYSVEDD